MSASEPLGREHPAAVLCHRIDRTTDSHGGLVLVAGEAGIGKTTLVTSVLGHARASGALVLTAACWEHSGSPGYWPWMQVVRALRREAGPEDWSSLSEAAGHGLAALFGEGDGIPDALGPRDFVLHDAVTNVLLAAARWRPVVVVLEDLHWADAASLRLLEFLVRHSWSERILVVGTFRDTDVGVDVAAQVGGEAGAGGEVGAGGEAGAGGGPSRPLFRPLLARARILALSGLDADEVAVLMERTTGRAPTREMAEEMYRRTGGNPFFVEQTAQLWASGSPVPGMAPGVRWTLEQRVQQLPSKLTAFLSAAAVLGPVFRPEQAAAVLGLPPGQAAGLVARAAGARLVTAAESGRFCFAHDLIREALYARLGPEDSRRVHAAALRVLRRDSDEQPPSAELARHAVAASGEVPAAEAVEYLLAAARDATGRLAPEEAAGHLAQALERIPATEPERRARVVLDLAEARYAWGDLAEARSAFREALHLARNLPGHRLLARAALTLHALSGPAGDEPLHDEAVREAHEALTGGAERAGELSLRHRAQELSLRMVQAARSDGDDAALGFGLLARHDAVWSPESTEERRLLVEELLSVARRSDNLGLELQATARRIGALLEEGDPGYLTAHRVFVESVERSGLLRDRDEALISRCAVAVLTGRFQDAEEYLRSVSPEGEQSSFDRGSLWRHQQWALLLARGRSEDVDTLRPTAVGPGEEASGGLLEALTAVQRGDVDHALRYLRACEADAVRPAVWLAPLWLRFQAQTAALSGDAARCRRVRAELDPLVGRWAVSISGYDVHGPYLLWRSVLDAALEDWETAVAGFVTATRGADQIGALPWSVEARLRLAETLLARSARGDDERAAALLAEVRRDARSIGMCGAVERADRAQAGQRTPAAPRPSNVFRMTNGSWTLRFAGRTAHLPDAKGLRDLHRLLARPGVETPAVELYLATADQTALAPEGSDLPGQRVLAETSVADGRRRLEDVDERIESALAAGEDGAAAEADRERQVLVADLLARVGGTSDHGIPPDLAERARKAVSGRIRYVLRRLGRQHPDLARHLNDTVVTGAVCAYRPEEPVAWMV